MKKEVEKYLAQHDVRELLQTITNTLVTERPNDMYNFMIDFLKKSATPPTIKELRAHEVMNSLGQPSLKVEVMLNGIEEVAGSSIAGVSSEALPPHYLKSIIDLEEQQPTEDGQEPEALPPQRFDGRGQSKAAHLVKSLVTSKLKGKAVDFVSCDDILCGMDNSDMKDELGVNVVSAASLAIAHACCFLIRKPLFYFIGQALYSELPQLACPKPLCSLISGGSLSHSNFKPGDIMITPAHDSSFREAVDALSKVVSELEKVLDAKFGAAGTRIGSTGGFVPNINTLDEGLTFVKDAVKNAGFDFDNDFSVFVDMEGHHLYNEEKSTYEFVAGKPIGVEDVHKMYNKLVTDHPNVAGIIDPFHYNDLENWKRLTQELGEKIITVGDTLYGSTSQRLKKGIDDGWSNGMVVKLHEAGTLTESFHFIRSVLESSCHLVVSTRNHDGNDTTVADFAVGIGAKYIRLGGLRRGERVSVYNRMLEIEEWNENNITTVSAPLNVEETPPSESGDDQYAN